MIGTRDSRDSAHDDKAATTANSITGWEVVILECLSGSRSLPDGISPRHVL